MKDRVPNKVASEFFFKKVPDSAVDIARRVSGKLRRRGFVEEDFGFEVPLEVVDKGIFDSNFQLPQESISMDIAQGLLWLLKGDYHRRMKEGLKMGRLVRLEVPGYGYVDYQPLKWGWIPKSMMGRGFYIGINREVDFEGGGRTKSYVRSALIADDAGETILDAWDQYIVANGAVAGHRQPEYLKSTHEFSLSHKDLFLLIRASEGLFPNDGIEAQRSLFQYSLSKKVSVFEVSGLDEETDRLLGEIANLQKKVKALHSQSVMGDNGRESALSREFDEMMGRMTALSELSGEQARVIDEQRGLLKRATGYIEILEKTVVQRDREIVRMISPWRKRIMWILAALALGSVAYFSEEISVVKTFVKDMVGVVQREE